MGPIARPSADVPPHMAVSTPHHHAPTEHEPMISTIVHTRHGISLCEIECWVDDGVHVIRAVDFDMIAMDEDLDKALEIFVKDTFSLVNSLGELLRAGKATEGERELFIRLGTPF